MARRTRSRSLGASGKTHEGNYNAAIGHAKRFLKAADRSFKNGACEGAVQSAMNARSYSDLAVSEAAAMAKTMRKYSSAGATRQQSIASDTSDKALMAWSKISTFCVRSTPRKPRG